MHDACTCSLWEYYYVLPVLADHQINYSYHSSLVYYTAVRRLVTTSSLATRKESRLPRESGYARLGHVYTAKSGHEYLMSSEKSAAAMVAPAAAAPTALY